MDFEPEIQYVSDRASYAAVTKAHKTLSKPERQMVIDQLNNAYNRYEQELLHIAAFRRYLYGVYNEKITNNQSIAVLSRDFNMSLKGHNTEVANRLGMTIIRAHQEEAAGHRWQAIKILLDAGLNMNFLTNDEVVKLLKANENGPFNAKNKDAMFAKNALSLLRLIVQYQETLFKSVISLAAGVVKRAMWRRNLSGDVIQESDLINEAVIAADAAVKAYKPGLHNGQSFTSFVYNYVNGMISKHVTENTRVVAIPRKVIDRYLPLQAVIDHNPDLIAYGQYDYEALAKEVSEFKGTPYSAVEVEWLLLNVSRETASLDLEVIDDNDGSSPITLGESLINQEQAQDIAVDRANLKENILKVIRDHTNIQEYTVMKLRWGSSKLLSLDQTAKQYIKLTGLDMNKGKVAKIEQEIFQRLKKANDSRLIELLEVLDDSSESKMAGVDIQSGVVRCNGRRV